MEVKICHISDTHNKHARIVIPECDILVHSGDISGRGHRREVEDFMEWFSSRYTATYKILIAGNHDLSFDPNFGDGVSKPEWLNQLLMDFESDGMDDEEGEDHEQLNFYLENSGCEIFGLKFWGSPAQPWFHDWGFNYQRGSDIAKVWAKIPEETDVLITHGPPFNLLDETNNDYDGRRKVGCRDLLETVKNIKPKVHMFGHIHEAYGRIEKEGTTFLNSSICTLRYEPHNLPQIVILQV